MTPTRILPGGAACIAVLLASFVASVAHAAPAKFTPQDFADARRLKELLIGKQDAEAVPLVESMLRKHEQVLGRDHEESINLVTLLATLHRDLGNKDKAIALFEKALAAHDGTTGKTSQNRLAILENLAQLHFHKGSFAKAVSLFRQLLELREQSLGQFHSDTVRAANNLATSLSKLSQYSEAVGFYERVLRFDQEKSRESAEAAATAVELGVCYRELGKADKAEEQFRDAIRIREKLFGRNSGQAREASGHLGVLYAQQGDATRAFQLLGQLKETDTVAPADTLETAKALNNMAVVYQKAGDYAKAEPLLQRAFVITERIQGKDHPDVAAMLNNLASLKDQLGQREEAEKLFQRALTINEKALGQGHPGVADSLTNLAALYLESGRIEKAKSFFERALVIYEKAYGNRHERVIACLTNLGETYARNSEPAKAKALFQRALSGSDAAKGPNKISNGAILNNLGTLYFTQGDPGSALPFLRRALGLYAKTLGEHNPTTVGVLENLALAEFRCGHAAEFDALAHRADEGLRVVLENVLSFASEEERLSWQYRHSPLTLFALKPHPAEFARCVFRYKGIVLDSIVEDRAIAVNTDETAYSSFEALRTGKQALWQATLATANGATAEERKRLDAAMEKVRGAEKTLARSFTAYGHTRRALDVEVAQVKAMLPQGTVLIDIVRYMHYLGSVEGELRYAAVVLPSQGELGLVPLGKADAVDRLVELFQKSIRGTTDDETGRISIQKLHEQVWIPIERTLPKETVRIIVSPDAQLSFVPFAALTGDDSKFLCEKYRIDYVASGRDLLITTQGTHEKNLLIFGNPMFAADAAAGSASKRFAAASDLRALQFASLPGTDREAEALVSLGKASGLRAESYTGVSASEGQLRSVNSPYVLHLATHGYFVGGSTPTGAKGQVITNPMQRSGMALAGAETTIKAWRDGRTPPTENDGILTGEEISTLNLNGTWLVTLSACDTGGGEVRFGEGILGLRRGFIQAGAKNLLMTLWPISDEMTMQIMLDFYARALKTNDASQALAEVQRDWLVKLRKERGLLDAVRLAGPFIMSSQGK